MFARVDHIGVAVEDLDAAIALYEESLQMELVHREVVEQQGVEAVLLDVGENHVELLRPLSPDTPVGKFLAKKGPGLQQLAYRVEDIDETSDSLRAKGLNVLFEAPRHGTANSRTQFVHPKSTGGVLVEFVQPAQEESAQH